MVRTRKPEARGRQHTPALERHPSQEGIIANTLPAGRAKSPLERASAVSSAERVPDRAGGVKIRYLTSLTSDLCPLISGFRPLASDF